MDVKTAIMKGDAEALRQCLAEDSSCADELIEWGNQKKCVTHPLHFVSDMLFNGTLQKGMELPLVDALIQSGSHLDFNKDGRGETALIGAASLGAEEVGLKLLEAGARPEIRGLFGETALHWAAMLGEDRLVAKLIPSSDLNLKDAKYNSPPVGWAIHGWSNTSAGNHGGQIEVVTQLVSAGARVEPPMLESESVRSSPSMLAALGAAPSTPNAPTKRP